MQCHLPLSGSGGPGSVVHFQQLTSLLPVFAGNAGDVPMGVTVMDAMKNALEPLRLRGAARCASRGQIQRSLHRLDALPIGKWCGMNSRTII